MIHLESFPTLCGTNGLKYHYVKVFSGSIHGEALRSVSAFVLQKGLAAGFLAYPTEGGMGNQQKASLSLQRKKKTDKSPVRIGARGA